MFLNKTFPQHPCLTTWASSRHPSTKQFQGSWNRLTLRFFLENQAFKTQQCKYIVGSTNKKHEAMNWWDLLNYVGSTLCVWKWWVVFLLINKSSIHLSTCGKIDVFFSTNQDAVQFSSFSQILHPSKRTSGAASTYICIFSLRQYLRSPVRVPCLYFGASWSLKGKVVTEATFPVPWKTAAKHLRWPAPHGRNSKDLLCGVWVHQGEKATWYTPLKQKIAPENRPGPKNETIVFQSSIFRCHVRFREGNSFSDLGHLPFILLKHLLQSQFDLVGKDWGDILAGKYIANIVYLYLFQYMYVHATYVVNWT